MEEIKGSIIVDCMVFKTLPVVLKATKRDRSIPRSIIKTGIKYAKLKNFELWQVLKK